MDYAHEISNKNVIAVFLVLLVGFLIAGSIWYLPSNKKTSDKDTSQATSSSAPNNQIKNSDDEDLIRESLINKTGIAQDKIEVTLSQKVDGFAKGTVGIKGEEIGGGYFLAAKVGENWIIVYEGQATPTCAELGKYKFPTNMVPECLNSSGNLVKR